LFQATLARQTASGANDRFQPCGVNLLTTHFAGAVQPLGKPRPGVFQLLAFLQQMPMKRQGLGLLHQVVSFIGLIAS
jgi:hypothetical protein